MSGRRRSRKLKKVLGDNAFTRAYNRLRPKRALAQTSRSLPDEYFIRPPVVSKQLFYMMWTIYGRDQKTYEVLARLLIKSLEPWVRQVSRAVARKEKGSKEDVRQTTLTILWELIRLQPPRTFKIFLLRTLWTLYNYTEWYTWDSVQLRDLSCDTEVRDSD